MKRVLFVDDDPMVLQGIRRMLHPMRAEWNMEFATSGAQALEMMAANPADVVVSDMRMPRMSGAELLRRVMQLYPKTIRIILSGYADLASITECVGQTHQFIAKPCSADSLRTAIFRALEVDRWLGSNDLKTVVARLETIPSLPSLYFEIVKELNSPDASLENVGATIARDPGMTAKILQLINSAFFGLPRHLTDPTEAVIQLGIETIRSLVLAIHVFSQFDTASDLKLETEVLYRHSLETGVAAKQIAHLHGCDPRTVSESFTAGLLHDIGALVLIGNLPDLSRKVSRAVENGQPRVDAERAALGVSHSEIGGYLLGLWGLPTSIVEAVLFHHMPGESKTSAFSALTAVHIADAICPPPNDSPSARLTRLDRDYLTCVGVLDRVAGWKETLNKSKMS